MAESIVFVVVDKLADLLFKQAREEIDLLTGVETELNILSNTLKRIQAVLDDAELKKITEKTVNLWLQNLEDVSYEIDDVLDEWNYTILKQEIEGINNGKQRVCCSFIHCSCFCFTKVVERRDVAVKVKGLIRKLDLIEKGKNQFSFVTSSGVDFSSREWKRVQSTSFVDVSEVFGRESDGHKLVKQLLYQYDDNQEEVKGVGEIVSLIGIGGIGKTTLAQLAYNDDRVKGHFEKRVWVCVSDPFDEIRIAKAIVESLESCSPNLNELDSLLQRINFSTYGQRFLLVLDDVWTEDPTKWEPIKNSLKDVAPGSTILLTTRSERVARVANATSVIQLGVLSDSESWLLFRQVAFLGRTEIEFERLKTIGWEITRKCKGLPLAIKTIGSLLRFKNVIEEWQKVLDSNIWELEVAEVALFPHLYLSYNDLSSSMRRCFSYCAVFPKDEVIIVEDLIRIWMAQGFLNSSGSDPNEIMELKGMEYFENLAMRSFFQDFGTYEFDGRINSCKMHDIVHDFAKFLTKRECLIIEGQKKEIVCENVRHLTWLGTGNVINSLSYDKIGQPRGFIAKNLKLESLTANLLNSLKLVRVLKLYECGLKEIPKEIGNLIHLRYLGLNNNGELRELPGTVYDLYNLQTLVLDGCWELRELPPGIGKLTKLRHLIIGVSNMKYPVGLRKLTCLQTLFDFSVGREYNKLECLKYLNHLRGSLEIAITDDLDDTTDAENADLRSKNHIQRLTFRFAPSTRVNEDAMEALKPHPNLQKLKIYYYGGTRLPSWMTSLSNLRHLTISNCFELKYLSALGILSSLETLQIFNLPKLKFIGPSFLGVRESLSSPPAIVFPQLIELTFLEFGEWEEWEEDDDDYDTITLLPRLCRLTINGCSKLKALPYRLLRKATSLKYIVLDWKEYNPLYILSTTRSLAEIKAEQSDTALE